MEQDKQKDQKAEIEADLKKKIPVEYATKDLGSLSNSELEQRQKELREPLVIKFLRKCDNNQSGEFPKYITEYSREYGLIINEAVLTNKGKLLLETYPNKILLILLYAEDKFPWLKSDLGFIQIRDERVYYVVTGVNEAQHVKFLMGLGILDSNYMFIDPYIEEYLMRRVRAIQSMEEHWATGQSPPANTYIGCTFNVPTTHGPNSPIGLSSGSESPISVEQPDSSG